MNKNDFLIIDPQGNIACIDEYKVSEILRGQKLDVQLAAYKLPRTQKTIAEIKKTVEKYIKYQWDKGE